MSVAKCFHDGKITDRSTFDFRELKLKYLIIENFIPVEEKQKFFERLWYDEDSDQWYLNSHTELEEAAGITARPVSADDERRPISDYSRVAIQVGRHHRYHVSIINNFETYIPKYLTIFSCIFVNTEIRALFQYDVCSVGLSHFKRGLIVPYPVGTKTLLSYPKICCKMYQSN